MTVNRYQVSAADQSRAAGTELIVGPRVCVWAVFSLTCGVQPLLSLSVRDQTLLLTDVQFEGRGGVQNALFIALQRGGLWGYHQNLHQFVHFGDEAAAPVHALDLQT